MTGRIVLVSTFSLLALAAFQSEARTRTAPVPQEKAKLQPALKPLQGTWMLVGYSVDGRLLRGEDARTTLIIEDDRWTITWPKGGAEQVEQGVLKSIDESGNPKVMDLLHDAGPYKGTTTRALYQVNDDALRYSCLVAPDSITDSRVVTATTTWKRKAP